MVMASMLQLPHPACLATTLTAALHLQMSNSTSQPRDVSCVQQWCAGTDGQHLPQFRAVA